MSTFDPSTVVVNPAEVLKDSNKTMRELILAEDVTEEEKTEYLAELGDEESRIDSDFNKAHENIETILTQGSDVMKALVVLAQTSAHPRAFEVAANMMKTLTEINVSLVELSQRKAKSKKELREVNNPQGQNQVDGANQTAVFVGSPHDLLKAMRDAKEKEIPHGT